MPRASRRAQAQEEAPQAPPSPSDARPYAVCAVRGTVAEGEGRRVLIQRALMQAWAELYGGEFREGRWTQTLTVTCPDGDSALARQDILGRVDVFGVAGESSADRMRDALVARAREAGMAGMGIASLRDVLDRLGARCDIFADAMDEDDDGRREEAR